jgi:hypothetical protein
MFGTFFTAGHDKTKPNWVIHDYMIHGAVEPVTTTAKKLSITNI